MFPNEIRIRQHLKRMLTEVISGGELDDFGRRIIRDVVLNKARMIVLISGGLSIGNIESPTHLRFEQPKLFDTHLPNVEDRKYAVYSLIEDSYLPALTILGETAFEKENFSEAKAYFQKSIDEMPSNAETHTNLAAVLWQLGEETEARESLVEALKLDPLNKDAVISFCEIAISDEEKTNAAELCEYYLKKKGEDAEISSLLNRFGQKTE